MSAAERSPDQPAAHPDRDGSAGDDGRVAHPTLALGAAIALSASGALPAFLTGSLGVQIKGDLEISDTMLGAAVAALFGTAMLTTAVAGHVADRLGWQRSIRLAAAFAGTALAGAAIAGGAYVGLVTFLMVGGIAFAITTPTTNLVLARTVPTERRGLAFGIQQSAVPLSTLLAGLAVPVIALTIGWRWSFALALVLPLTAVVAATAADGGAMPDVPDEQARTRFAVPSALLHLAAAGAFAALSLGAMHGFVVISAVRSGIAEGTAGVLVAASSLLAIGVRIRAGRQIDRVDADGFRRTAVMMALGSVGFALLAVQSAPLVVPAMVLVYGAGWGWPGLFQYGVTRMFPAAPARATGIIQTGFASGTAVGPIAFGFAADRLGYTWAWSGVAMASVVAAVLVDVAARRLRGSLASTA